MAKVKTPTARVKLSFDPATFTGAYRVEGESGNYFLNPDSGLLVKLCERKDYSPLRPRWYLMHRKGEAFRYLTSLYSNPNSPDLYTAEIQRRYFTVEFSPDRSAINVTPQR